MSSNAISPFKRTQNAVNVSKTRWRASTAPKFRRSTASVSRCCGFSPSWAGIDPAFQVQDEIAAERRFEERWRTYLDSLGSDPGAIDIIGRLLDLGMTPAGLQETAHALWQRGELAEHLEREPLTAPTASWPDLTDLREGSPPSPTATVPDDDRLLPRINATLALLDGLIASPDERETMMVAASLNPRVGTYGNIRNWRGAIDVAEARRITSEVIQTLIDTLEALRSAALSDALALRRAFRHD